MLRKAALKHALTGSLAVFLIGLVVFFILADIPVQVGWVGLDSIVIMLAYFVAHPADPGQRRSTGRPPRRSQREIPEGTPSLRRGLIGFGLAAWRWWLSPPVMVAVPAPRSPRSPAWGRTFIGTTLVAIVTSLPELVTTIAAIRIGADDMAIGNLFGSNLFNMFALGLTDLFYTAGPLPGRDRSCLPAGGDAGAADDRAWG